MNSIIEIDNILISSAILTECFVCDYAKCKGACCVLGDSGAPLEEDECKKLEEEIVVFENYLSQKGRLSLKEKGPFVIDSDGDLVTPLNEGAECSYSFFDKDKNCLCAIEKAHFDGVTAFRKPISCWLYPIRVSKLSNGMTALNLHEWDICLDAFVKGQKEGIPVFRFLKDPLIFSFGKEFYSKLEEAYILINKD